MTKLTNGLYTGSHQNETAPDLEKIKQAEEAKAELRKAFLASSEEWRDTFYSHSEELGIKIAGIEQVRMDPYSLNTIWENEYESPEKNHFECSLEVSAKPDEYGPFVR